MLTSEHAIVEYEGARAVPDRLSQSRHAHYVEYAQAMLDVYRNSAGAQRGQLHRQVEALFHNEQACPPRRISAFCKLLDDASTYRGVTDAWKLRLRVFQEAAARHPLVEQADRLYEHTHREVKRAIAQSLGRPWGEIEDELYGDVLSCQRLESFEGYDQPADLLRRYNVAQLQACLYKAQRMTAWASDDFHTILRYIKLAKLLHTIEQTEPASAGGPPAYRIDLTGPASDLLPTRRYGIHFARFLAPLLTCRSWRLRAQLQTPWGRPAWLELSDRDGFTSHLPSPEPFDSAVEEKFAAKFGEQRDGWTLRREGVILHHHQKTFVPDFLFRHEDGTEVLLEIVGFWTPQYLEEKRRTLRLFADQHILLVVPEKAVKPGAADDRLIAYKTALKVGPVVEALERRRR